MRIVLDTNILISALLKPTSVPSRVVTVALSNDLIVSEALAGEFSRTLQKPYVKRAVRMDQAMELFREFSKFPIVRPTSTISDCRDPKDNHILALALDGKADLIVTGDDDLLVPHPWRNIPS